MHTGGSMYANSGPRRCTLMRKRRGAMRIPLFYSVTAVQQEARVGSVNLTACPQSLRRRGRHVLAEEKGYPLENASLDALGTAKRIVIDKDTTTHVDGAGSQEQITARVHQTKQQM